MQTLKKTGAVGVLIYDNQDKGFPIELPNVDQMPAAFISRKDGLLLKDNPKKPSPSMRHLRYCQQQVAPN
ncbi:PA domain protein [Streptococcus pyogenes MGAS2111]|nr:PA domain protein [Streptococcus pyogenes MGAS2111]